MPAGYAAAIGAVASLAGGAMSADAAKSASQAQVQASQQAQAYMAQQNALTQQKLTPFLASGTAANQELATLLGVGGTPGGSSDVHDWNNPVWKDYVARGGFTGAPGQTDSSADQEARSKIYANASMGVDSSSPQYGSLLKPFTGADLENSPGYQFTLQQGLQGITNKAAAGGLPGGPLSGAAAQEAIKFNQGLAGTTFNTAFNQDMTNKQFTLGSLSGASGAGQNAAVQQGGFGQNAAAGIAGNMVGAGNAQAAGIVGGANATSQGINNAINGYQNAQTLRSVFGGGGVSSPDAYTTNQMGGMDGLGGLG